MQELPRERYLSRIRPFYREHDIVKVIVGVRGSGKSTLLRQIMEEVSADPEARVAFLDLESKELRGVKDPKGLMEAIDSRLPADGTRYLFMDEVRNVEGFERVVNAYRAEGVSVFIAGSGSDILDGEQATRLTGRYVAFTILPFSFSEVRDFRVLNGLPFDKAADFQDYMENGGFPGCFPVTAEDGQRTSIADIVGKAVGKEVFRRRKVRNKAVFAAVLKHLTASPGSTVSTPSVSGLLGGEGISVKPDTVGNYLDLAFGSGLVSRCPRYDIARGCELKTLYRTYDADTALLKYGRASLSGETDQEAVLENIVYNELISRGYRVFAGKLNSKGIDFVVSRADRRAYVQVAYIISDQETADREFGALLEIKDAYPKYLVTMDPITSDHNGVRHLNLIDDFLLGDGFSL